VAAEVRRLLDAYPWAGSTARLRLLGFDVVMRADDERVTTLLDELYAAARAPADAAGDAAHVLSARAGDTDPPTWEVHLDGLRVLRTRSATIAFRHLLWEANQQAIACSTDHVLVHAAAVAHHDAAVVLPGPMGAGKSTLAAALVQAGLGYLTDEVVALEPATGLVRPYPKYLAVGPALASLAPEPAADRRALLGDQHLVPVDALRPGAVAGPTRPRVVVLPRYERGAPTALVPVSPAEAFPAVAAHVFHLAADGDRALATVAAMVEASSCYSLVSGDVDAARDAVLGVLP
jgi:hypothetical protein